jgi:hypothetical protein
MSKMKYLQFTSSYLEQTIKIKLILQCTQQQSKDYNNICMCHQFLNITVNHISVDVKVGNQRTNRIDFVAFLEWT